MKNIMATILSVAVALLVGSLFMNVAENKQQAEQMKPVGGTSQTLKAFQIGAYTTEESANKEASEKNAKVIRDGDYYYVYISILSDAENIEKMIQYLNEHNYYYYVKNINSSNAFLEELYKYEELMKETTSEIAFLELNKRILNLYEV